VPARLFYCALTACLCAVCAHVNVVRVHQVLGYPNLREWQWRTLHALMNALPCGADTQISAATMHRRATGFR